MALVALNSVQLLTPEQLKSELVGLIEKASAEAKEDFDKIMKLESTIREKKIDFVVTKQLDFVSTQSIFAKAESLITKNLKVQRQPLISLEEQQELLLEMHKSIVKLGQMVEQMKVNRSLLLADMEQVLAGSS